MHIALFPIPAPCSFISPTGTSYWKLQNQIKYNHWTWTESLLLRAWDLFVTNSITFSNLRAIRCSVALESSNLLLRVSWSFVESFQIISNFKNDRYSAHLQTSPKLVWHQIYLFKDALKHMAILFEVVGTNIYLFTFLHSKLVHLLSSACITSVQDAPSFKTF